MQRREFNRILGASGLMIGFYWEGAFASEGIIASKEPTSSPFEPNAYIRFDANGIVTLMNPRPDAGNDVRTSLPMILAEELDVDWLSVKVVQADTDAKRYGKQRIWGSESVSTEYDTLRKAGASVRMMFTHAAATKWNVGVEECTTKQGMVRHSASGRQVLYQDLLTEVQKVPIPQNVVLKKPSDFTLIGQRKGKVDAPLIVRGKAEYGIDVVVPNMVYAAVRRAPTFGAKVARFDAAKAKKIRGVIDVIEMQEVLWTEFIPAPNRPPSVVEQIILIPSGVAVIADNTWAAFEGVKALEIEWNEVGVSLENSSQLVQQMREKLLQQGITTFAKGDEILLNQLGKNTEQTSIYQDYEVPYLAHATMEPMNCVADVREDRAEFWASVGEPQRIVSDVGVALLNLKPESIKVNTMLMGGSFGRRSQIEYAAEAGILSRRLGKPVKLTYSREDDMQRGYYRPMSLQRLSAFVDKEGLPTSWNHRIVTTARLGNAKAGKNLEGDVKAMSGWDTFGGAAGDLWYNIPHIRTQYDAVASAPPRASWRAVAHTHNVFAIETFMDTLAQHARKDPIAYRLALLELWEKEKKVDFDLARFRAVINAVRTLSEWTKPLPKGWGRGFSCLPYWYNNYTYIAQVVEISIGEDKKPRIQRVWSVLDCGTLINPSGAEAQVEGGSLFGLSAAMYGNITLEQGRVQQSNFHDYPIMRISETPKFVTQFIRNDADPGPMGEVATAAVVPALANAIMNATGKLTHTLPIGAKN